MKFPQAFIAILLILSWNLFSFCKSQNNKPHLSPIEVPPTDTSSDYFVNVTNQANFLSPGFVRCPLLEKADETNIFISKTEPFNFKKISCNGKAELFYSGDTHIPYILKHDDTVYIKDGKLNNPYILSSLNEIRNNEINYFQAVFDNKIPLLYTEFSNQRNKLINAKKASNNLVTLFDYYKTVKLFTSKYFEKYQVSNDFKLFIEEYIKFDHYIKIFTYINIKSQIDSLIKNKYFDFTSNASSIFYNCNYAFQGALYQYALYNLNANLNKTRFESMFSIFETKFNNQNSSLVKFLFLKNFVDSLYFNNKENLIILNNRIGNIEYQNVILEKINDIEFNTKNRNKIINQQGDEFTLNGIISKFSGKVVLVDFWASWCAPCRHEFASYPKLRSHFDTSKIKFVFISIDRTTDVWLRALKSEKLNSYYDNYLMVNLSKDKLEKMNLQSIPRYYLYDTNGKLVNNNAPYPSDKNLVLEINKLIQKK